MYVLCTLVRKSFTLPHTHTHTHIHTHTHTYTLPHTHQIYPSQWRWWRESEKIHTHTHTPTYIYTHTHTHTHTHTPTHSPDIPESVEVVEGVGEDVALLLDFDPTTWNAPGACPVVIETHTLHCGANVVCTGYINFARNLSP